MKVIGHEKVLDLIKKARASGRLAHALCFVGPDHVGKKTVARALAQELLLTNEPERHADYYFVARERDEKTEAVKHEISVEQIRRLREQLSQSSFFSGAKVAIIDEAETLSTAAANALLKTLEEPSSKTTIILVTSELEKLPATIASRLQVLRFKPVPVEVMIEAGIPERAARLAMGCPGVARAFAESENLEKFETDLAEFKELMSAPVYRRAKIIESWFGKKKAHSEGRAEFSARVRLWKAFLRESLLAEAGTPELVGSPFLGDNIKNAHAHLRRIEQLEALVSANANVRYALEACFLGQ